MRTRSETIRKIVSFINNPAEQGGLWLPNIQRKFVWEISQIEALFDSIMREYPISTLLFWKTRENIKYRKFIDIYTSNVKTSDYEPENDKQKLLVLDGQQRLQSFYIALKGSYEGKELYMDILSGIESSPDNIKYHFKFLDSSKAEKNWIKFKDLVFSNEPYHKIADNIIIKLTDEGLLLDEKKKDAIVANVSAVVKLFKTDDVIAYQEVDSVDNPDLYTTDDVVEVFIRANSGGTKLEKSDLLFSLLTSNWDYAEENIENLQDELNKDGFNFSRDFLLKVCLCLIGAGAKYDVKKFRKKGNLEKIEDEWDEISNAIKDVKDFISGKTFIKSDKAMPSYFGLIPVIYFRYNFKKSWESGIVDLNKWLLRVLLTGSFSGSPDGLVDQINKKIKDAKTFDIKEINQLILNAGRNLNVTNNTILKSCYGDKNLFLLFNVWYGHFGFNFVPAYSNNLPQIDHIFPQSILKNIKKISPKSKRKVMKYKEYDRNQIANCMLLTQQENGEGGKGHKTPEEWFNGKDDDYLDMHMIPKDKELWKIENYEKFIERRKFLLLENFKDQINDQPELSFI